MKLLNKNKNLYNSLTTNNEYLSILFKASKNLSVFSKTYYNLKYNHQLFNIMKCNFTGKTETGWKYTTPLIKMINCKPIKPPGFDLEAPDNWDVKKFFYKLGGDLYEHDTKFNSIDEILKNSNTEFLKKKELPCKQRKYLLRMITYLRRGLLTFDYLDKRSCVMPCRKLTKPIQKVTKIKKVIEEGPKSKTASSASGSKA